MHMNDNGNRPATVLEFWYSESAREHWFKSSAEFDREMEQRFGRLHRLASEGRLDAWQETPEGALALVILLDQFTRNLYRGSQQAYSNDARALAVSRAAIDRGLDRSLSGWHKAFLYMPFMHSEELADQEYSAGLFTAAGLDNARYALHHRDIIRRFGRFPHRNEVLGRESTDEEIEYLNSTGAFRG